jgi:hypothetical protein
MWQGGLHSELDDEGNKVGAMLVIYDPQCQSDMCVDIFTVAYGQQFKEVILIRTTWIILSF